MKFMDTSQSQRAKRAVVTGATGSLGAVVCRRLLAAGWVVHGVGSRPAPPTLVTSIPDVEHHQIDLSSTDAPHDLLCLFRHVAPDLVLHAAVSYGDPRSPPSRIDELERMFRVNAFSFYLAFQQYCADSNLEPFCSCVVVNSDSIYHAGAKTGAYASSKAALRVFTTALADACRSENASVSTLLLGPLADATKVAQLRALAEKRQVSERSLRREYLRRSNPFLVIDDLIDLDACYEAICSIVRLRKAANGMLCKLDGGSSGSLV